jgi:hypothetical protein
MSTAIGGNWEKCPVHPEQWVRPGDTCYYCDALARSEVLRLQETVREQQKATVARLGLALDQTAKCTFCGKLIPERKNAQKRCLECSGYWNEGKRVCHRASQLLHHMVVGVPERKIPWGELEVVLPAQKPNTFRVWKKLNNPSLGYTDYEMKGVTVREIFEKIGQPIPWDIVFTYRKCRACGRRHNLHFVRRDFIPGYTNYEFEYFFAKKLPQRRPKHVPVSVVTPDFSDDWKRLGYKISEEEPHRK